MKKTRVAKAHGFDRSINPARRMAKTPKDLKRSIIDSSAFWISSGDRDTGGVGVDVANVGLLSLALTPALFCPYFWISASTLDSVISSGER